MSNEYHGLELPILVGSRRHCDGCDSAVRYGDMTGAKYVDIAAVTALAGLVCFSSSCLCGGGLCSLPLSGYGDSSATGGIR